VSQVPEELKGQWSRIKGCVTSFYGVLLLNYNPVSDQRGTVIISDYS
jgi:hypothetical protein